MDRQKIYTLRRKREEALEADGLIVTEAMWLPFRQMADGALAVGVAILRMSAGSISSQWNRL
jgi:hypothetical protein